MNRTVPTLNARDGFTLFETMLALALTLVLILAIQSALMLHWKYRTAGAEQTQDSLTQLAVLEDFQTDLRLANSGISPSELLHHTELKNEERSSLNVPEISSGPEIRERFLKFEQQAKSSQPIGFVGNEQLLAFSVSQPSYRFEKAAVLVPHQKLVIWFVNRGDAVKFPLQRQGESIQWQKVETSQLPLGLVRIELEGEFNSRSPLVNQAWELIDPAVTDLTFNYLLSNKSVAHWDSFDHQSLPGAVGIVISRADQLQRATVALPQSRRNAMARRSI